MITELLQEYDKNVSIIADTNDETVEYIIEKYKLTENLDF